MTLSLHDYIEAFSHAPYLQSITGIGRGIEREALRVIPQGRLSEKPHAYGLGSALTHPLITTDFAENLLEFITPVSHSPETTLAQLQDIQKFALTQIDNELLWPLSMPCFVDDANKIPLAQYGSSNIGKMKTVYRQGLKNRYGSMMQVISGIHYNFSFSNEFWQNLQQISGNDDALDDFISARYFALLRNYKRYCWLIPYLFGCSSVICSSFLANKKTNLPLKRTDNGYLYLEYATSMRMSDLGYTNSDQSALHICYNSLQSYVDGVKNAINLASDRFAKLGVKVDGHYQQLNANVLQIENELYAPIRPKRVTQSGEKPSQALQSRGVEYIEVRTLDVNPFVDTGISIEQMYFLDVFLTFCALAPSDLLDCATQQSYEKNMRDVVLRGRDPALLLQDNRQEKSLKQWGSALFDSMAPVAALLDNAYKTTKYSQTMVVEQAKILQPELTPSAQLLHQVRDQGRGLTDLALNLAQTYRDNLAGRDYQYYDLAYFSESVAASHAQQATLEADDKVGFDQFLQNYFAG